MNAIKQHGKLIARIAENLPELDSQTAQFWIEGKNTLHLQNFLAGLKNPQKQVEAKVFETFKVIKIGTGLRTAYDFIATIEKSGGRVSAYVIDLMHLPDFHVAEVEQEVELVAISAGDLGLPDGSTFREILKQASSFGLAKCPAEVGPQLRIQYPDQPAEEFLYIAMKPINDSSGRLDVFSLRHSQVACFLDHSYCAPDSKWNSKDRWVFRRK